MVDSSIVSGFITALRNKFELKSNKKTDITGSFNSDTDSYPTAQAVKDFVEGKNYLTSHQNITGKLDKNQGSTNANKNVVTDASGNITVEAKITKTSDLTNDGDGTNAFVKTNDSRLSDARTPTSHVHGNLSNEGKIGTASGKPLITTTGGAITTGNFGTTSGTFAEGNHTHNNYLTSHQDISGKADKSGGAGQITDTNAHSNLGTSAGATQATINTAVDTKIGALTTVELLQVVTGDLPTASASTMNKLYVQAISGGSSPNAYGIYVTVKNGSSYSWEKVDDANLQGFLTATEAANTYVPLTDPRLTNARTPTSHTHGDITNDGKIGSAANKPLITTTGGKIAVGSFGTSANTFAEGNHTHSNYVNLSAVDSEIESYITAITNALNS